MRQICLGLICALWLPLATAEHTAVYVDNAEDMSVHVEFEAAEPRTELPSKAHDWISQRGDIFKDAGVLVEEDCVSFRPCQLKVIYNSDEDRTWNEEQPTNSTVRTVLTIPQRYFVGTARPQLRSSEVDRLLQDHLLRTDMVADTSRLAVRLFLLLHERDVPLPGREETGAPPNLSGMDTQGVIEWLQAPHQHFHEFEDAFRKLGVDGQTLLALDLADLDDLGVGLRIQRKRLLRSIAEAVSAFESFVVQSHITTDQQHKEDGLLQQNNTESETQCVGADCAASLDSANVSRRAVIDWYNMTLHRSYVQQSLLQFSARDVLHLQRHARELQDYFERYFGTINGQRQRIEDWIHAHRSVLDRFVVDVDRLVDPAFFSQLYSFIQTRMVASPGWNNEGSSVLLVPGLDLFNHRSEQHRSETLQRLYNCSFLWYGTVTADTIDTTGHEAIPAEFFFNAVAETVDVVAAISADDHNGAELFLQYGRLNNYHLMTRYGFAVPFNQYDSVKIQLDSLSSPNRAPAAEVGHAWAAVILHAHSVHAAQVQRVATRGDIPLRLVRDHGKHAIVVEILGTKNQLFEIGYDGVLPDTLLAAIRYLTMDTAAAEGDDHELAAFGAPDSDARQTEIARRLAEGEPVSQRCERKTLAFLIDAFEGTLGAYSTTLKDDIEILRGVGQKLPSSTRSAVAFRLTSKAIMELTIMQLREQLMAIVTS